MRQKLESERAARKQSALFQSDPFEEFLAQVSFKRTNEVGAYSQIRIDFTFVPFKLGTIG